VEAKMIKRLMIAGSATAMVAILAVALMVDSPTPSLVPELALDQEAQQTGGPEEGIEVHGHWVLEVRDPDGSRVVRREFENDLDPHGGRYIGDVLRGAGSIESLGIILYGVEGNDPCTRSSSGDPTACYLVEPSFSHSIENFFPTLTTAQADNGLRLSGTMTATKDTQIAAVQWTIFYVPDGGTMENRVTTHATFSPVPVLEGQSVLVTVTIAFS
jgi:hypothetical protein